MIETILWVVILLLFVLDNFPQLGSKSLEKPKFSKPHTLDNSDNNSEIPHIEDVGFFENRKGSADNETD